MLNQIVASCISAVLLVPTASAQTKMQIVYSKTPITSTNPTRAKSTTSFVTGDTIYARIYSTNGQSIRSNQTSGGAPIRFTLKMDGSTINGFELQLAVKDYDKPYADINIIPQPGTPPQDLKTQTRKIAVLFKTIAERLDDQPHEFTINMGSWGNFPFKVTPDAAGKAKLAKMIERLEASVLSTATMPTAGMKNRAMEKKMLGLARKSSRIFGGKPIRVVITDNTWNIEHHKRTGKPVERYLWTALVQRETKTKCFYQSVRFMQRHMGGGRYGALQVGGVGLGSKNAIACKTALR